MKSSRSRLICASLLALMAGVTSVPVLAQKVDSAVTLGEGVRVWSDTLQEERRVLVYLPDSYHRANQRYPVMYLLDAESQFRHSAGIVDFLSANERMPETIIIAVTNTNRGRDLVPAATSTDLTEEEKKWLVDTGGADAFLKFLVDELQPWVESHYRTEPYKILTGHSYGGLFALHALVTRPDAFQAYVAVSPSLWWDKQTPLARAKEGIAKIPPGRHYLRLSWADNENIIRDPTQELVNWLKANPPAGVQWDYRYYPGDDHGSTPHRSLYDGLEQLFIGWRMPVEINDVPQEYDLATVEAYYARQSKKYGYTIKPSSSAIFNAARTLMKRKDHVAAIALIRKNIKDYPWLHAPYMQLGEVLEQTDCPKEAIEAYTQALRVAVDVETTYQDPVASYRQQVAKLRKQIAEGGGSACGKAIKE